jgi:hypothetical protein
LEEARVLKKFKEELRHLMTGDGLKKREADPSFVVTHDVILLFAHFLDGK